MQDAEEPKNRSLPEQKGPHPTVVRGGQKRKRHQIAENKAKQKVTLKTRGGEGGRRKNEEDDREQRRMRAKTRARKKSWRKKRKRKKGGRKGREKRGG